MTEEEKKIVVTLSEYKSDMMADMGLQNLLAMHTKSDYDTSEKLVEQLKNGEEVTVRLDKEGSTSFFRGLKSYKLKYAQSES